MSLGFATCNLSLHNVKHWLVNLFGIYELPVKNELMHHIQCNSVIYIKKSDCFSYCIKMHYYSISFNKFHSADFSKRGLQSFFHHKSCFLWTLLVFFFRVLVLDCIPAGGTNESDSPSTRKCLRKTRGELLLREYEVGTCWSDISLVSIYNSTTRCQSCSVDLTAAAISVLQSKTVSYLTSVRGLTFFL